eukprot:518249-Amphidinium_carterae.2
MDLDRSLDCQSAGKARKRECADRCRLAHHAGHATNTLRDAWGLSTCVSHWSIDGSFMQDGITPMSNGPHSFPNSSE